RPQPGRQVSGRDRPGDHGRDYRRPERQGPQARHCRRQGCMTHGRIAAIVLAAGTSSRLGQPKQLLPVDGQPLLSRTLDVVRASTLQPRVLVLGGYADQIDRQVRHDDLSVVFNPTYQQGQSTSLAAGLAALPISVEGAVIVLGDQPLATPWLLDDLAERFDPATHVAVRPRY